MLFDYIVSNPPYQQLSKDNKNTQPIYQEFQKNGLYISKHTVMIYPGEKWLMKTGQAVIKKFSDMILNSSMLQKVYYYKDFSSIFPSGADAEGGITIVVCDNTVNNDGEWLLYIDNNDVIIMKQPVEKVIVNKTLLNIVNKCVSDDYLSNHYYNINTYNVSSYFIEDLTKTGRVFKEKPNDNKKYIRILANNISGAAGRTELFWILLEDLPKRSHLLEEYNIVVSSRSTCGANKRSQSAQILGPGVAFGGTRFCVSSFTNLEEARNFYNWLGTDLIRCLLYSSTKRLMNFGVNVPYLDDYSNNNELFKDCDDSEVLNDRLCSMYGITDDEKKYMTTIINTFGKFGNEELL